MKDKLKSAGTFLIGLVILAALIFVTVLLISGAGWVSDKLLPWFSIASVIAFALVVVVLLPLSAIRATRSFASVSILYISYLFGVTAWMEGLVVTLTLWGTGAVIFGLCLAGVGVLPIGILAALFRAKWETVFELMILTILTFGSRFFALWLAAKMDAEAEKVATAAYLN